MSLFCLSVVVNSRPLIPWTITSVPSGQCFQELFSSLRSGAIDSFEDYASQLQGTTLTRSMVGQTKEDLVVVDSNLCIQDVCRQFGSFVKLAVERDAPPAVVSQQSTGINAFQVLMAGSRRQSQPITLPSCISEPRNRKEALYNDILAQFAENSWEWIDGGNTHGKNFIQNLRDTLWYLDGHHETLKDRSCPIPEPFLKFVGYNVPEKSKHRKRDRTNLSYDTLVKHVSILQENLLCSWMQQRRWGELKECLQKLVLSLDDYCTYLRIKSREVSKRHSSSKVFFGSDSGSVTVLPVVPQVSVQLSKIDEAVREKHCYDKLCVVDFCSIEPRKKYRFVEDLKRGLTSPAVLYTCSLGSNLGNYNFLWRIPQGVTLEAATNDNIRVIDDIKRTMPSFHSRALRRKFMLNYGKLIGGAKSYILRQIYNELTGDAGASMNASQAEVDARVQEALDMEDPDILIDLRHQNTNKSDKYKVFWTHCLSFLNEITAVHERRHDQATYMAKAISVRDLIQQVKLKCPEDTEIPSEQWVRLQFCPKNPRTKSAAQFKKRLPVKMMIQKRQFRQHHIDSHYCAAIFRYLREYAILLRNFCNFFCMDDKHRVKVGEPGVPVAAAERGRQVLVSTTQSFEVCDHDFTRFSLVPTVLLHINIPSDMDTGSWYDGQVYVALKDSVFEPSSSLRHAAEMYRTILTQIDCKPVLFLYTDGGPDHRTTYISTQLSMIALFLNLNLDFLCAARTAPHHSWRNPVERMMSILNLGFQSIGLMRSEMSEEAEAALKNCNSLSLLRKEGLPFKEQIVKSVGSTIELLSGVVQRLELSGKKFKMYHSCSDVEIETFWEVLQTIEPLLLITDTTKKHIKDKESLSKFFDHCCIRRHYFFSIKKCGAQDCSICKPPRLSEEEFTKIKHLPDPMPGQDDHYLSFDEAYKETETTEQHRPSLSQPKRKRKILSYSPSVQHVRNVQIMLQCEECDLWRLIFSKRKLSLKDRSELQAIFDEVAYTCGATMEALELPEKFSCVAIKEHQCFEPIEKLYYAADLEPICIYCAECTQESSSEHYPICSVCVLDKEPISKRVKS